MKLISPVHAVINNPILQNPTQPVTSPKTYINSVLQSIFTIFMIVGVLYFAWHFIMGGFHFMTTEGDAKKFEDARHELTYAVIGLFVVFMVFVLLKFMGIVFGIPGLDQLQLTWPTI